MRLMYTIQTNYFSDCDVFNLIDKFAVHISFTSKEEFKGKEILKKNGIPENAKFVCMLVRDSAYLDRDKHFSLREWKYHNFRDGDIDNYVLAAEELARRGYYIFRMGVKVLKPLISSNPKIIDYANSEMRSDFMDIYLGAKCSFCIFDRWSWFFWHTSYFPKTKCTYNDAIRTFKSRK